MLKAINITAEECGMGMYLSEKEVNPILPESHPNKFKPVIKIIRNNNDSFRLASGIDDKIEVFIIMNRRKENIFF